MADIKELGASFKKKRMITTRNLYKAIEKSSNEMLNDLVDLKRIKSAKITSQMKI